MTDSLPPEAIPPADTSPQIQSLREGLTAMSVGIGIVLISLWTAAKMELEKAERRHDRAELLNAYKVRHRWKKSDVSRLASLNLNKWARARVMRLQGRGRPIVDGHRPFGSDFLDKVVALGTVLNPATTPIERCKALKLSPWWAHNVEALYRGEHALAKESGVKGPSSHAEEKVGRALGLSASTVRSICAHIRRERDRWDGAANFPSMTLEAFENWMKTGKHPHLEN